METGHVHVGCTGVRGMGGGHGRDGVPGAEASPGLTGEWWPRPGTTQYLADGRVHAVLHAEHADGRAAALEALEQGSLHLHLASQLGEDGGGELLGVPDQHHPERCVGHGEGWER